MLPQIKIAIRPNNQITVTCGNYRKVQKSPSQAVQNLHDRVPLENVQSLSEINRNAREKYECMRPIHRKSEKSSLDIISKFQRDKKPPSSRINKPKNFTRHSGQKVREAGAAMQIACSGDTRFCHEITLTLPANNISAFRALAAYSSYAINRLFQLIRRKYKSDVLWFFVWEYQKRGALHLHIAIYHPDESEGLWIAAQLIELWHTILIDISLLADTDMFLSKNGDRTTIRANHQHHTAPIREDVGRYFSKYAGKVESKNSWHCRAFPIARFWGSSKSIKEIIKQNSFECSWDYSSNVHEQEKKMTEIIDSILSKLTIVSSSSYDFNVVLKGKNRLNRYPDSRKILSTASGKCIASGTRYTFYCESGYLTKAIGIAKGMANYF